MKSKGNAYCRSNGLRPLIALLIALGAAPAWAADGAAAPVLAAKSTDDDLPLGKDALFGDDDVLPIDRGAAAKKDKPATLPVKGYLQFELARTTAEPDHWSKMRTRADVSSQGALGEDVKWKLGARLDYDAVYGINNFYPFEVRRDQRLGFMLRENYLDYSAGNWDFRFGRQHAVWGEMVGLLFADVVSARDMREFVLPEFDAMRIPQWAARAEYFKDDFHAEFLWIPVASYDITGKPGAEFFPNQPQPSGFAIQYRNEVRPERNWNHGNYGVRLSTLKNGWDVSGFYYSSMDNAPTFYREVAIVPTPTVIYEARHDRIDQVGGTLAKDFGSFVLKGEGVYTHGRQVTVLRFNDADGVVPQDTLDWALGLDFTLPAETRFNVQFFQRATFGHDPDTIPKKFENGYTLYLNSKLTEKLEAQAMWINSLQRNDWLFRPRLAWNFERNWRLMFGADVFHGPETGLFGRYDGKDRLYGELRYAF